MLYSNNCRRILITAGMAVFTFSIYPCAAQSQPFPNPINVLIAQNLGGIVREIPLTEIPQIVMSAAKTVTDAQFTKARNEIQRDGSLRYILRGKNQQGYVVEVQVTAIGTVVQVDEQIDPSGVPEMAMKTFKRWSPNTQLISTWRSTRLGEVFYQFVIENFWLEITPDGSKVIINQEKIKYQ